MFRARMSSRSPQAMKPGYNYIIGDIFLQRFHRVATVLSFHMRHFSLRIVRIPEPYWRRSVSRQSECGAAAAMFVFQGVPFVGAGVKRCLPGQGTMWERGSRRSRTCLHSVLKPVRGDQSADVLVQVRHVHTCQVSPEAKRAMWTSVAAPGSHRCRRYLPQGRGSGVASFACYDTRCAPVLSVKLQAAFGPIEQQTGSFSGTVSLAVRTVNQSA